MRVLVIEDQAELAETVALGLQRDGMAVDIALDGAAGLRQAAIYDYDVIVLDRDLPGVHGDRVCETLVEQGGRARVLMLTASAGIEDRVAGLSLGADDYLPKPFAFAELLARVRALLRRGTARPSVLEVGDLRVDLLARRAERAGSKLDLTQKEFALLEYLARHAGEVVTRTMISEHVWDMNFDSFSNVIDVYIRYLRRKIDEPFEKKLIHTRRGVGYMLAATP
jgi:DNA-binding response OmpR family regulator